MTVGPHLKKIYWSLVLAFFLFSMAIGIAGYFFYENQKENLKQEKWEQLGAISDLKVRQIINWRRERLEDGAIISKSPFIAHHIQQWLQDPKTTGAEREILDWMASLQRPQQDQNYQKVLLLDAKGWVRLSVPEGEKVLDPFSKALALEAVSSRKVILSDLYRGENPDAIHLSLLVPLFVPREGRSVTVAVILLRIDPHQFLYPLIQSWPTPSRTSETLLVRREGEEVLYLNELRHRKNTALTLRFPISRQQLPAAMAARGQEGIAEGFDYRGVPVLAAMRRIPDSLWFLVARVDQEEIYAPIRTQTRLITVLVGALVIGIAVSVGFLWRGQHLQDLRRSESEIRKLNEDLRCRAVELQHINKELETFSYSISHDLRTPLVAMNGLSRILSERYSLDLDKKGQHFLCLIQKATVKMLQLIDDLMAFSRCEHQEVKETEIEMGEMARNIFDELKQTLPERRIELDIKALPAACGDRTMMRQVMFNLLSNAIKFTKTKEVGIIEIGCIAKGEENVYYVKDNGVGFDMQHAAKLFGVFQRCHSADEFEGTGVGLAIVQRIIQRHKGHVWAEGRVNEGATFYFSLPIK